jgi:hypothetical protein
MPEVPNRPQERVDSKRHGSGPKPPERKPRRFRRWVALGLLAVVCIALAAWWRAEDGTAFRALLRDNGRSVGLDGNGNVHGLDRIPASERLLVAAILTGGSLPLAPLRADLTPNGGAPRVAGAKTPELTLADPVGRVVFEDRPVFRWNALAAAVTYRVQVFDSDHRPVAQSPAISETSWQPAKTLARDRLYSWEVTAMRGGLEVVAPTPPAPEARFRIVDPERAGRIAQASLRVPQSHLELCALYAEAGLDQDCLREIEALEEENPDSALLVGLRAQLLARRPAR